MNKLSAVGILILIEKARSCKTVFGLGEIWFFRSWNFAMWYFIGDMIFSCYATLGRKESVTCTLTLGKDTKVLLNVSHFGIQIGQTLLHDNSRCRVPKKTLLILLQFYYFLIYYFPLASIIYINNYISWNKLLQFKI